MHLTPTVIIYSTEEVFSCSVFLNIVPGVPFYRSGAPEGDSITAVVYFSGCATGYASLRMSKEIADVVTRDFLFG